MRSAILLVAAAAAVSANSCEKKEYASAPACTKKTSTTYKTDVYTHQTYNCDATAEACHAPDGYGKAYGEGKGYTYQRKFAYPGPKTRFCLKIKGIKAGIKRLGAKIWAKIRGAAHAVANATINIWLSFKAYFEHRFAILKSDWERFEAWKECKENEWKAYWEYYYDLCRTRKALWDDAMREFHRHWHHYKKCRKTEYEESKKKCKVEEVDYDNHEEYKQPEVANYLGYTPYEKQNYGVEYDVKAYGENKKKYDESESKGYGETYTKPYSEVKAKADKIFGAEIQIAAEIKIGS